MIRQLVVGTDGSEYAAGAYEYALHFASSLDCEIKAVFAIDTRKTELPLIYSSGHFDYAFARTYIPPDTELKNFFSQMRKDTLDFSAQCLDSYRARAETIPFTSVSREGLPSVVLTEEARSGDLLIIGQKGEHARFDRTIVGSTTEDVVRSSPRPVLICPAGFAEPRRLLFPYDGSLTAERALQFCVNAFENFWEEIVILIAERDSAPADWLETLDCELRYIKKHNIPHRILSRKGSPVDMVLKVAEEEKADIILVGAHGRNKIRTYLLGSTTAHLVRQSHLPILIVY